MMEPDDLDSQAIIRRHGAYNNFDCSDVKMSERSVVGVNEHTSASSVPYFGKS
jgi:hypothetical protein